MWFGLQAYVHYLDLDQRFSIYYVELLLGIRHNPYKTLFNLQAKYKPLHDTGFTTPKPISSSIGRGRITLTHSSISGGRMTH